MKGLVNFYLHFMMDALAQERLSQFVKKLRGDRSQRSFAKTLGVSYATIRSWEECESMPGLSSLQKLAEYTNQTIEDLIFYLQGDEDKSNVKEFNYINVAEDILPQIKHLSKKEKGRLTQILIDELLDN